MKSKANISQARFYAFKALQRIEQDQAYTDLVLSKLQEEVDLSAEDRALLNEIVRGTIRWKKRLDWIVDQLWQGKSKKLAPKIRWLLWIGLYQIDFLQRIPESAAVNEIVKIGRKIAGPSVAGILNGMLRSYLRQPQRIQFPDEREDPVLALAVRKSHPEWLIARWIDQFGFRAASQLCDANNTPPVLCVRPNRLKIKPEDFENLLLDKNVEFNKSIVPGFFRLYSFSWPTIQHWLDSGLISIQDESAGLPALVAEVQTGDTAFDLCAAPGGKSTHIAELTGDQATVISADINPARCRLVRQACKRLGLLSVSVIVADANDVPLKQADKIILDAPCSGLGVMRRKVDLRWRRKPEEIIELAALQKKLLQSAARQVRPGGILVYCTCTIEPEENEKVIQSFLEHNENFKLAPIENSNVAKTLIDEDGMIRTFPHLHQMDGSFVAKLVRVK